VDIPVVLIATAYGTTSISSARSYDLSEGGIRIATTANLQEQQSVSLEFKGLDDGVLLKLYGQIRHGENQHYGIQFITPSEQQRKEIRNLLMN
jgi:c-di-GMP-binding flagellar brake protein YcgR